ncbi:hypothetical protein HDU96_010349 [Phlyctochytrium bullatum]|nr:hypothetical protein HDU96_010349 [Phlyctochytrium bullatum]
MLNLCRLTPFLNPVLDQKLFEHTQFFNCSWDTLTAANWRKYPNELSNHVISVDILSREVDPETGVLRTERLLCCKQNAPSILRAIGLPIPEVAYFREISELDPKTKQFTAKSVNLSMRNIMSVHETIIFKEYNAPSPLSSSSASPASPASLSTTSSAPSPTVSSPEPSIPPPTSSSWTSYIWPISSRSAVSHDLHSNSASAVPATSPSTSFVDSAPSVVTEFFQQAQFQAAGFVAWARVLEDAAANRFKANASKGKQALELVIERVLEEAKAMEGKAQAAMSGVVDGISELTGSSSPRPARR